MARLILGSAQFGYKYGITNKFSAVSDTEILKIGNNALESGITTVDTAISYGDAEITPGIQAKKPIEFAVYERG